MADSIAIGGNSAGANSKSFSDNVGVVINPYTTAAPPQINPLWIFLLLGAVAAGIYVAAKK